MRVQSVLALAVVALAIAACGGGGGGGSTGPSTTVLPTAAPTAAPTVASTAPATSGPLPAGYAVANVKITIPADKVVSSARRAQTVGTGTASITFSLVQFNGASASSSPQSYGLTSTSPGCGLNSSGNLVCSLNINAPIGSDIFLAQTYKTDGSLTGSGAVALSVAQNSTNTASLSLDGQVASVYVASSSTYLGSYYGSDSIARGRGAAAHRSRPAATSKTPKQVASGGNVTSMRIFVIALDSSNNVVLNPSTYDQPISLQLVYLNYDGEPDTTDTPDVSLSVVYNPTVDPSGCGGSTTTSANFGTIEVCSPSDVVTANLLTVQNGDYYGLIIGSVGSGGYLASPAPSASPTSLPTGVSAGVGTFAFDINAIQANGISLEDYDGYGVSSVSAYGLGSAPGTTNLPMYNEGNGYNTVYAYENGFGGPYILGGTCGPYATLAQPASTYNYYGGSAIVITPTAVTGAAGCTITIGDGTSTVSLPLTVTTTSVIGS